MSAVRRTEGLSRTHGKTSRHGIPSEIDRGFHRGGKRFLEGGLPEARPAFRERGRKSAGETRRRAPGVGGIRNDGRRLSGPSVLIDSRDVPKRERANGIGEIRRKRRTFGRGAQESRLSRKIPSVLAFLLLTRTRVQDGFARRMNGCERETLHRGRSEAREDRIDGILGFGRKRGKKSSVREIPRAYRIHEKIFRWFELLRSGGFA